MQSQKFILSVSLMHSSKEMAMDINIPVTVEINIMK